MSSETRQEELDGDITTHTLGPYRDSIVPSPTLAPLTWAETQLWDRIVLALMGHQTVAESAITTADKIILARRQRVVET